MSEYGVTRRRLLVAGAAASVTGLAGCLGSDGGRNEVWNQQQGDGGNSGWIPGDGPDGTGSVETIFSGIGYGYQQFQPRTDGKRVFIATRDIPEKGEEKGRVTVRAATVDGDPDWETEVTFDEPDVEPPPRSLSVTEGIVVVPSKAEVVGLDAESGSIEWRTRKEPFITSAVQDGTVYGGTRGAWAISASDGSEQWSTDLEPGTLEGAFEGETATAVRAVDGDRVYLGGRHSIAAVPHDGDEKAWHYRHVPEKDEYTHEVDGNRVPRPTFMYAPVVADGIVYATRTAYTPARGVSGWVVALDATTGERKWRARGGEGSVVSSAPVVVDGTVYVGSSPDPLRDAKSGSKLHAVDAETGDEQWTVEVPAGALTGYPAAVGDRMYLASGPTFAVHTGEQYVDTLKPGPAKGFLVLRKEFASDGESLYLTNGRKLVAHRS